MISKTRIGGYAEDMTYVPSGPLKDNIVMFNNRVKLGLVGRVDIAAGNGPKRRPKMNNIKSALTASIAFVILSLLTSVAQAQVGQTFVSVQGKDTNTCDTHDKPCRNISSAITKVQAGGDVVVLDSGGYLPFSVSKAVTVVAAPGVYAGIIVSSGLGVQVTAGLTDVVVLRGLTLSGSSGALNGIQYSTGASLHVESCIIQGFSGNGIRFDNADNGQQLFVKDTTVRNIGISAIFVGLGLEGLGSGPLKATIDRCLLENNNEGIFATDNARVTVRNTVASRSRFTAFLAFTFNASRTSELNIENCLATSNDGVGISASGQAGTSLIRVSNTTVTNNAGGVAATPGIGTILSRGNNSVEGNSSDGSFSGTFTAK